MIWRSASVLNYSALAGESASLSFSSERDRLLDVSALIPLNLIDSSERGETRGSSPRVMGSFLFLFHSLCVFPVAERVKVLEARGAAVPLQLRPEDPHRTGGSLLIHGVTLSSAFTVSGRLPKHM